MWITSLVWLIVMVGLSAGSMLGDYKATNFQSQASRLGNEIARGLSTDFYITGPAGIAGDTIKLFEQADFDLLLATIVIILVLLIVIYRSPLLAFIPLLATAKCSFCSSRISVIIKILRRYSVWLCLLLCSLPHPCPCPVHPVWKESVLA
ncbi:MMPL family transporter [Paenibacillus sp. LC231]|uniref:MMPL family transporter n=1 Tax=Paenibacillus sp. LC231 TaxID=1120679 RepID=UPI001F3B3A85|nr:MMPL family transporter [Paenibacillus sp. LC231]